jgi:hypothetical protein
MWCVAYMFFWNKVQRCWLFLAPLLWAASSSPSLSSFNQGLYTLALVKYKIVCPNTYVIKDGFINIYVTSGHVIQHIPHNITN